LTDALEPEHDAVPAGVRGVGGVRGVEPLFAVAPPAHRFAGVSYDRNQLLPQHTQTLDRLLTAHDTEARAFDDQHGAMQRNHAGAMSQRRGAINALWADIHRWNEELKKARENVANQAEGRRKAHRETIQALGNEAASARRVEGEENARRDRAATDLANAVKAGDDKIAAARSAWARDKAAMKKASDDDIARVVEEARQRDQRLSADIASRTAAQARTTAQTTAEERTIQGHKNTSARLAAEVAAVEAKSAADVAAADAEAKAVTEKAAAEVAAMDRQIAAYRASVKQAQTAADAAVAVVQAETDRELAKAAAKYTELRADLQRRVEQAEGLIKQHNAATAKAQAAEAATRQRLAALQAGIQAKKLELDRKENEFAVSSRDVRASLERVKARIAPFKQRIADANAARAAADKRREEAEKAVRDAGAAQAAAATAALAAREGVKKQADAARAAAQKAQLAAEASAREGKKAEQAGKVAVAEAAAERDKVRRAATEAAAEASRAGAAAVAAAAESAKFAASLQAELAKHKQELARKADVEAAAANRRGNESASKVSSVEQSADNLRAQLNATQRETAEVTSSIAHQLLVTAQLRQEVIELEDAMRRTAAAAAARRKELQSSLNAVADARKAASAALERDRQRTAAIDSDKAAAEKAAKDMSTAASATRSQMTKVAADMSAASRKIADMQALMVQTARTAGASDFTLGTLQAIADLSQQLGADVDRMEVDKAELADELEAAKQEQLRATAKAAAVRAELADLASRLQQQQAVVTSVVGVDDATVVRYKRLEAARQELQQRIEAMESEIDAMRDGGSPGPATLARARQRAADRAAAVAAAAAAAGASGPTVGNSTVAKPPPPPAAPSTSLPARAALRVGDVVRVNPLTGRIVSASGGAGGSAPTIVARVTDVLSVARPQSPASRPRIEVVDGSGRGVDAGGVEVEPLAVAGTGDEDADGVVEDGDDGGVLDVLES